MTDIKDLLTRAVDVPIPIDAHGDLRRGRARLRRRRLRAAAGVVAGALAVSAVTVGVRGALPGRDPQRDSRSVSAPPDRSTRQERIDRASLRAQQQADAAELERGRLEGLRLRTARAARAEAKQARQEARPHESVDAAVIDPGTLVHTPYYDVAPAPDGWHLVGAQPEYVMVALDGTDPSLTGDFDGKLMVLHGLKAFPQDRGTPIDFDGRTFYSRQEAGSHSVSVSLPDGDWLSVQWPETAGFALPDMVAYLDAVQPLAGAVGAS